jgi:uncharacterized protein YndB with AHSA1/START domain
MTLDLDPDLDLRIDRVIRAPRARVWKAWTDPVDLARWWLPAPTQCRVDHLDVVPGGAFVTSMSDDGASFGLTSTRVSWLSSLASGSCSRTCSTVAGGRPIRRQWR